MSHGSRERRTLCFKKFVGAGALGVLVSIASIAGPVQAVYAEPCGSSVAKSTPLTDPVGDADSLAPDISGGAISTDNLCGFTLRYDTDQSFMLTSDTANWFIDTDGNLATGSQGGFRGADYAMGVLGSGFAGLTRYNAGTGLFEAVKPISSSGPFSASLHLNDLNTVGGTTMQVAGAVAWRGTYATYYDWAPNIGFPTVPFTVEFGPNAPVVTPPSVVRQPDPVVPITPPAPVAPAVVPAPQTVSVASTAATCVVPTLKGLSLAQARKRLRAVSCSLGRVSRKKSRAYADKVIATTPKAGRTLAGGATIDVVAGKRRTRARKASTEMAELTKTLNAISKR